MTYDGLVMDERSESTTGRMENLQVQVAIGRKQLIITYPRSVETDRLETSAKYVIQRKPISYRVKLRLFLEKTCRFF